MSLWSLKTGKWWKVPLGFIVVALLVLLAVFIGLSGSMQQRLVQEERYARDQGYPLTPAELNVWLALPDRENSALKFATCLPLVVETDAYNELSEKEWKEDLEFAYGVGWPEELLPLAREHCKANEQAIEALLAVPRMERGRYPYDYERDLIQSPIAFFAQSYLGESRRAARMIKAYTNVCAMEGRDGEAIKGVETVSNIRRSLNHEPTVIGQLVGISIGAMAADLSELTLSMVEASEDELLALQNDLRPDETEEIAWRTIQFDRVMFLSNIFGFDAQGRLKQSNWPSRLGLHTREILKTHQFFNNLSRLKSDEVVAYLERFDDEPTWSIAERFAGISASAYVSIHKTIGQYVALRACAYTGMAAYRHKLEHGAFPETLEALVPEYLEAVPEDPFVAGEPLKMVETAFGICIYSTSYDGVDNGGRRFNDEGTTYQEGADVTFWCFETPGVEQEVEERPEEDEPDFPRTQIDVGDMKIEIKQPEGVEVEEDMEIEKMFEQKGD